MSRLNLWRMTALVATGLLLVALACLGIVGQGYNFMSGVALRQQGGLIKSQSELLRRQSETIQELRKQLFGDNETLPRPFPPGAPA